MPELANRVVVITGAAGGLGSGLARGFAEQGSRLALVDRDRAGLETTRASLAEATQQAQGISVHAVDVSSRSEMGALPQEVLDAHGRVDVLVNNAGVNLCASIDQESPENARWLMGVNFFGVLWGCQSFFPHLERNGGGWVVNVSSMASFLGLPTQGVYCASKAAVQALSETLSSEWRHRGVGVTTVHPGALRTGLLRTARFADPALQQRLAGMMERYLPLPGPAARRIVRAVRRGQRRVVVGLDARMLDLAARIAPGPTLGLLSLLARVTDGAPSG